MADAITEFERKLDEPLQSELSTGELEQARRRRIAEDNVTAQQRLMGLMTMPRRGDPVL